MLETATHARTGQYECPYADMPKSGLLHAGEVVPVWHARGPDGPGVYPLTP